MVLEKLKVKIATLKLFGYCCCVSIRTLPLVHFHIVHYVLTCVVREFQQGSVVSNPTRPLCTYWKWRLQHLTSSSSSQWWIATGRSVIANNWPWLSPGKISASLFARLTSILLKLNKVNVLLLASIATAAASSAAIFKGWWSVPFPCIAKMATEAFHTQLFDRYEQRYRNIRALIMHCILPYLNIHSNTWTHLCSQYSKCKYGRTWIETRHMYLSYQSSMPTTLACREIQSLA